jgi:hypothetical protein
LAQGIQAAGSLIGTLSVGDPTQLIGSSADLTNSATSTLSFGGGAASSGIQSNLNAVLSNVEKVTSSIPGAAKLGTITDLTTLVQVGAIAASAVKAANSASTSKTISANAAAKADVSKFSASASEFASSLPANKAKDWRDGGSGDAGDYFNAGKYAIQTLAADIET